MASGPTDAPVTIAPVATDSEAIAIVAAIEAMWPRAVAAAPDEPRDTSWRFSSRNWVRPLPVRRLRPWR